MKKTLIALVVAASAAVSGSAMAAGAFTPSGLGGELTLGGSLTQVAKVSPWEAKVGDSVSGLDSQIQSGQTTASVVVPQNILAVGIRTQTALAFSGISGISPQLQFNGVAIAPGEFTKGVKNLSLTLKDNSQKKIGTLSVPLTVAGVASYVSEDRPQDNVYGSLYAQNQSGDNGFYGGLSGNKNSVVNPEATLQDLSADLLQKLDKQNMSYQSNEFLSTSFADGRHKYSAAYGAGIMKGSTLSITLDAAPSDAVTNWTAALPVTISYL